jgi:hypothetical protein
MVALFMNIFTNIIYKYLQRWRALNKYVNSYSMNSIHESRMNKIVTNIPKNLSTTTVPHNPTLRSHFVRFPPVPQLRWARHYVQPKKASGHPQRLKKSRAATSDPPCPCCSPASHGQQEHLPPHPLLHVRPLQALSKAIQ